MLRKVKGDCYQTTLFISTGQVPWDITFTNRRILFRGGGVVEAARLCYAIPYEDIQRIEPYAVFVFPYGIRTVKGAYHISVRKRKEVMVPSAFFLINGCRRYNFLRNSVLKLKHEKD